MPGARATGKFAAKAITRVAIADAMAVAVKTAPGVIPPPILPSIPGLTARIGHGQKSGKAGQNLPLGGGTMFFEPEELFHKIPLNTLL
jgi:hypothetical protein